MNYSLMAEELKRYRNIGEVEKVEWMILYLKNVLMLAKLENSKKFGKKLSKISEMARLIVDKETIDDYFCNCNGCLTKNKKCLY
jgi:hypothetical protein